MVPDSENQDREVEVRLARSAEYDIAGFMNKFGGVMPRQYVAPELGGQTVFHSPSRARRRAECVASTNSGRIVKYSASVARLKELLRRHEQLSKIIDNMIFSLDREIER